MGLVVEHRFEHFAALAIARDVVGDQRGVGVLAALEQRRAADAGDGALAVEFQEQLIAHHGAAGGEGERVEARMRADRGRERRDMQRVGAFADDLHMIDMGVVADEQFERGIDLIVAAGRALMAFDQHGARARLDDDQRAHESRGRLLRGHEQQMQRPLDGRAGGDADHRAVAHQGGIERDRDIAGRRELAEMRGERRIAVGQRGGERADREPRLQIGEIGQFGDEGAVDEDQAAGLDIAEQCAGGFRPRLRRGVRRARQRLGIAHQRAQIGIFPLLDAAMRQAFFGEHIEGRLALRRNRVIAGQPRARLRKVLRQRGLGRGLDGGDSRRSRQNLFLILGIAARFELERQFLAAGLDDAAVRQHVHDVGHDVGQQPLVMRDDDEGAAAASAAG